MPNLDKLALDDVDHTMRAILRTPKQLAKHANSFVNKTILKALPIGERS